ncbi:hypothetical protein EIK77_006590 [Talaromyces pinophilus]|nr:hypothetical protein EIK77_006590 [Talaromyces pinophilus]
MDQNSPPPPPPPPKSAIPRRGPPLTAIRTDLAQQQQSQLPQPPSQQQQQQQQQRTRPVLQKPRPQRPRPTEVVANQPPGVPLQPEPARKVASKTSLRGLFARNKALREERKSETTLPAVGERRGSTTPSTTVPDTPRSIAPTLASGSTLHASSQVATPTESTFTLDRPGRGTRVKPEPKSKVSSSWTPPPLFQAYPQASKHARLAVPNIAPDTILRIHATQAGNFRNPFQPGEADGGDADADVAKKGKKDAKDKKPVKRGGANSLDQIVFLKKIFVLATAGYLLQYSGEGSYDRLPEKIMRLGPASAAFASDSIPGKHHVVQISQKSTDDGTAPAATGRTFLSRFGLQTAESRRSVKTYLVIMSSAQEMNSWLIALRKTIEALGGKKYVPELAPGEDSETPEVPSNTLLAHRGSRLLASRKSSLRESNPPSPLSDSFPLPPSATTTHRKSFYQEEEQERQTQQPPRIPSPVKTSNRLSISGPLDIVTIPSTTSTFGDSDIIFENPRDAPQPTPSSKIIPNSPPPLPPAVETPAQSPAITPRLRKPSSSISSNPNRRSLNSYTATQLERQGEVARASRPLSFVGNGPTTSLPPQNTGRPGPNVRLSLVRGESSRSMLSDDATSRKTPTLEPSSKVSSRNAETPSSNIGTKRDSILNTQKRQSLISSSRSVTPPNISAIATARTIPTIPPRKYSLTRSESSESVTPTAGTPRYYQQNKLPDMNHTPRLPQQRLAQLTQSRLPSVTEKERPLTRLPKINSDSSESTTPMSTPPPSNLARFALGKDRANRVSASTSKAREPQSRSTSALNHQQPRQPTTASALPEDQAGLQSRTTTPASSPQTPQTPREESSRRSSIITSQPQYQQTSPRARRNPNLSFLPPAPPPNVPLPQAPPPNIAFRHIPLWQKRHLQQPSHPPQSQLPQPPPLQPPPQQTQQQQTHLPRPSISSSLTSAASSPAPPPAASSGINQQHSRRRSSELRSLHLQMANMLNNSIMHRKQSDVSLAGTTTTTTTTATNTANATPTSEYPPPLNMNMNMNMRLNPHPQRRSQSPQKRDDQRNPNSLD